MIYLSDLEDYNTKLEKGIKKLTGYNDAFQVLGIIILFASFFLGSYLYMSILDTIPENSTTNLNNIMVAVSQDSNQFLGYSLAGVLAAAAFCFFLNRKLLVSQMKNYVEELHPKIISAHKAIFADHSDEAIDAFREERNKVQLVKILKNYNTHIKFVIDNYNNFNINQ